MPSIIEVSNGNGKPYRINPGLDQPCHWTTYPTNIFPVVLTDVLNDSSSTGKDLTEEGKLNGAGNADFPLKDRR
jgi:hypothetical protein